MKKVRGLSQQLVHLLLVAGTVSILLFLLLFKGAGYLIDRSFPGSKLQVQMITHRVNAFHEFVTERNIAASDFDALQKWCSTQPLILMEIYRDNRLLFNSDYSLAESLIEQNIEVQHYDWYSYYEIPFSDGMAELLIYSDESYILHSWSMLLSLGIAGALFLCIVLLSIRKTVQYIYLLCDEIGIMGAGDLQHPVTILGENELGLLARELDQLRGALAHHRQTEAALLREQKEMVAGLSHDLKTPLTKMLLYTEIIQQRKYQGEQQLNSYLTSIQEKGYQMKTIADSLLQYSLLDGTPQQTQPETMEFSAAFYDLLSEFVDCLSAIGFSTECQLDWTNHVIRANPMYLRRILDNILSNLEKYADPDHPVMITLLEEPGFIGFSFFNKKKKTAIKSRSRIGLQNLMAMLQQMGGTCNIFPGDRTFEIQILFSIADI